MHDAPMEDHNQAMFSDMCRDVDAKEKRIKELESALKFYAEPDCWLHDEDGVFFMAGAFDGKTMIDVDEGDLARKVLGIKTLCVTCGKEPTDPDSKFCTSCAISIVKGMLGI